MKICKFDIRVNTFVKPGVKEKNDPWGVYCITGFQGSGKTYFAVYLLNTMKKNYKIYTNIKSLKLTGREIEYFEKIGDITDNIEKDCIFVIDEISKKYTKNSSHDKEFYSWLQQSRKRGRIVILITQEWKEVPMWLRRPVRFMYHTRRLGVFPIFVTSVGDALNCTYNVDTNEWECPVLNYIVYKRTKSIANCYDTFEPINEL